MSEEAYPLAWPMGKPRTPYARQRRGAFKQDGKPLTMTGARRRLTEELGRLGARYVILSSNVPVRLDGLPRAGQRKPDDPGVCAYFQLDGKPYAMACDTFSEVEQNMAAIAGHIDATRTITRYGVASAAETLQAFQALPAPGGRHWTAVLGLTKAEASPDTIKAAHRRLLLDRHPDRGGSDADMAEINAARDQALKETNP
ncbi:hypothetical protein ASG17_07810 [Brevundimonas sp. Leaf363]|uniref:J domain-containing protein n=1 Tax=Brevundimonas sp. Leaf363 TaxID=1736353 RepID=UPI0006FB1B62|nr:J domain-containing protein [Brevundimonas sp. Leaf363]KQS55948.1 hypothetical protein ASG17_07810 [Brevundimonas sp. Leaf363]